MVTGVSLKTIKRTTYGLLALAIIAMVGWRWMPTLLFQFTGEQQVPDANGTSSTLANTDPERAKSISIASETAQPDAPWATYLDEKTGINFGYSTSMSAYLYRGGHYATRYAGDPHKALFSIGIGGPLTEAAAEERKRVLGPSVSTNVDFTVYFYRGDFAPEEMLARYMDDIGISDAERSRYPIKVITSRDVQVGDSTYRFVESRTDFDRQGYLELSGHPAPGYTVYVRSPRYGLANTPTPKDDENLSLILKMLAAIKVP